MGAATEIIDTATDIVSDVGSSVDDFVNEEIPGGWATVAVVASPTLAGAAGVPASAIPYVAPAASAAVTLDQGGDLEQALLNAGLTYGAQELARSAANSMRSGLTNLDNIQYEPIDNVLSGLDTGDVIPATEEQLRGLYDTGGVFSPQQTVGIQPGQIYGPGGPGYYDEITGKWVSDPNGPLPGPLNPDISGSEVTMAGWSVDPYKGQWTSPSGEVFQSTPWNPNAPGVSGADILRSAGALPGGAMSFKDLATIATLASTANSILNPPKLSQATTPITGFPLAPIPSDWKSPTYSQAFTPIDLNSLFTDQNLLIGTQWENLPSEIQFANAPTMQALTDIIGSTLGQNTVGNQSVKG